MTSGTIFNMIEEKKGRKHMSLDHLEYIISIAKYGTISAAARHCHVSQPTLSRYLSNLESELETQLFIKEHKKCIPTPAGTLYIDAALNIQDIQKQTMNSIIRLTAKHQESIRIGATPFGGSAAIAAVFKDFLNRFPNVSLPIKEENSYTAHSDLLDGTIDLGIMSSVSVNLSDLDWAVLGKSELLLQIPSFHPIAQKALSEGSEAVSVDIRELENSPFILPGPNSISRQLINLLFQNAGFTPTVAYETTNTNILFQLPENGVGIGIIPSHNAKPSSQTIYVSTDPKYYIFTGIAYRKSKVLTDAEKYLIYLLSRLKEGSTYTYTVRNSITDRKSVV